MIGFEDLVLDVVALKDLVLDVVTFFWSSSRHVYQGSLYWITDICCEMSQFSNFHLHYCDATDAARLMKKTYFSGGLCLDVLIIKFNT